MALPYQLTNVGNPVVDATQLMANFNYLYGLWTGSVGNYQTGTFGLVPADGTATQPPTSITFPSTFPNTIGPVVCTISNYSGTDATTAGLAANIQGNPTRNGFVVVVQGGLPGTTCTINWIANGT